MDMRPHQLLAVIVGQDESLEEEDVPISRELDPTWSIS
jgi:hypothetical protein